MKKTIKGLVILSIMSTMMLSVTVFADAEEEPVGEQTTTEAVTEQPTTEPPTTEQPTTEQPTTEEPTTGPVKPPVQKITAWSGINGVFYNNLLKPIPNVVAKGIDVSHYQEDIDWNLVNQSDVDYAIIRCGYGDNIKSQDDRFYEKNIKGCEKYNIPYGIYIYSYATTTKQAISEAEHVLRLIKSSGAKPTYPIYIDFEDAIQSNFSPKKMGDIATAFSNKIIAAGYKVGVYANLNWWNNKLTDGRFANWAKWVAQYNSACAYKGRYEMWQATSTAKVSGVRGNTDVNFELKRACDNAGHIYSQWVSTKKATVFKSGKRMRICSDCGRMQNKAIAKLKATGKLNKKSITLKVKKKYKKLKVLKLSKGDGVKKYTTSNKKIAKVTKKGVIAAGKKKGKATITVTLKSGKKLKLKVNVIKK